MPPDIFSTPHLFPFFFLLFLVSVISSDDSFVFVCVFSLSAFLFLFFSVQFNLIEVEVDPPNAVSIFLQVPMYTVITAGEVMFSVTGLEFAYSQAPPSMKALCQAAWLWTVAFGNLVVIIIAESSLFANQVGMRMHESIK